jgi:uncharacterized membrane protein
MQPLSMKTLHSRNHPMTPAACSVLSSVRSITGQALATRPPCSSGSRGRLSRSSTIVRAAQDSISIQERVVATVPFLVPMLHGLDYGKFALAQNQWLLSLLSPLGNIRRLYSTVPFLSLAVFFAIYIGIINQRETWSRYVRFNAMQAILLDIVLILPGVFEQVLRPPTSGFGLTLYINAYNTIFFSVLACWLYGSGSCLLGRTARLPLVADAADQQVPY